MKLIAALLSLIMAIPMHPSRPRPEDRTWFIFLVTGPTQPGKPEEVEAMQNKHLANFQRLFAENKLFMAGPLQDPAKVKRGIIGVVAPDRQTLMSYFEPDPYVMSGIMAVDAQEWKVDRSRLNHEFADPDLIAEFRLVYLKQIRPTTATVLKQHGAFLKDTLKPKLDGQIMRNSAFEQVIFVASTDTKAVQAEFDRDPLVRLGYVAMEIMPLWTNPGVFKP